MDQPAGFESLPEILHRRARAEGGRPALLFLGDGRTETAGATYAELDRRARSAAAALADLGCAGRPVLLAFPSGLELVEAFLGCLYAGAIAVPCAPPNLELIARDCGAAVGLTTEACAGLPTSVRWVAIEDLRAATACASPAALEPGAPAMIQYSPSGQAKGVLLTHANLAAQERMIQEDFGHGASSDILSGLSARGGAGLVGGALQALFVGARAVLLPPRVRPRLWLEAVTRYRTTTALASDSICRLCLRLVPEGLRRGLNLRPLDVVVLGGERVQADTLERLLAAFGPSGLRRDALYPCYGLAEATLLVSGPGRGRGPRLLPVDGRALTDGVARPLRGGDRLLTSSGRPLKGVTVRIVDPFSREERLPGRVGEIWVAGPNVAQGYWGRPEQTRAAFGAHLAGGEGPFLRTEDLGFLDQGELYVTGRISDAIVLRRRSYFPEDIEGAARAGYPPLRPRGCAAFSVESSGLESLVILVETPRLPPQAAKEAKTAVARAVLRAHDLEAEVHLVLRGAIPRAPGGEPMRRACRQAWLAGKIRTS